MKNTEDWKPFIHPYASCMSSILINEFIRSGVPYYPVFAYSFEFIYAPRPDRLLGQSIADRKDNYYGYWDIIYRTYGIKCCFEDIDTDKDTFFKKMRRLLADSPVPCLIDGYYDPSTEYADVYHQKHDGGHGRYVTKIDSHSVYYYATYINDPSESFSMSLDDFYAACEQLVYFTYPKKLPQKEKRHRVLRQVLYEWFVNTDHTKTFQNIEKFSKDIRNTSNLDDEIDHEFEARKVPTSEMFKRLHKVYHARGATLEFIKGYAEDFENKAYEKPILYLQKSVELWKKARWLLVKYGMAPKRATQEAMANCLLEISHIEREFVTLIQSAICEEMDMTHKIE